MGQCKAEHDGVGGAIFYCVIDGTSHGQHRDALGQTWSEIKAPMIADRACTEALRLWIQNPRRLISLGAIVKAIHLSGIQDLAAMISVAALRHELGLVRDISNFDPGKYLERLENAESACSALSLRSTLNQINRIKNTLQAAIERNDGPTVVWDAIEPEIVQMGIRYFEEMEYVIAYHLEPIAREMFDTPTAKWQDVLASFPSTLNDIEEMGKCLALGRPTASVFHAMRILECGLRALAVRFNVKLTASSWGGILKKIGDAIEDETASAKARGSYWRERTFYSGAMVEMGFFRDAWRNHVMHARSTYFEETAPPIMEAIRRFMVHLATRLKE